MRRLKRGGHGGARVIVPHGILFGDGGSARIKEDLLSQFNLHTVVRLPEGVFSPYTNIATNLIFFDTSGATDEIWYWEQPQPEGRKKYSKTQPLQYEEFAECLAWWKFRKEGPQAWKVRAADLIKRDDQGVAVSVNLDLKNPHAKEVEDHRPPKEIIGSAITKERAVLTILEEIRAMIELHI